MIYVKCCKFIALNLHKIHVAVISFGLPVDACKWTFGLAPRFPPPSGPLRVPHGLRFGTRCTPKSRPSSGFLLLLLFCIVRIEQLWQTMCDGARLIEKVVERGYYLFLLIGTGAF